MNKTYFFKSTVMPFVMMCSAMLLTPPMLGMQDAYASVQQQGSISGTVVDSQGEPIIGASVIVTGTSNGPVWSSYVGRPFKVR